MKKILFLAIAIVTIATTSFAQHTTPRYSTSSSADNTGRVLTLYYSAPAYASTIAIKPRASENTVVVGQLTGNVTITATTVNSYAGDIMRVCFSNRAAADTVTLSTGFKVSATTVAIPSSKYATMTFIFDGTYWIEASRTITAWNTPSSDDRIYAYRRSRAESASS